MMRRESIISGLVLAMLLTPSPALAYLDPGTGSLLYQIAVGGLLAALTTVKLYWRKLRPLFSRRSQKETGPAQD